MSIDFKELKRIVDETILTEGKCVEALRSILMKENEALHSPALDKIILLLGKWPTSPPVEILKQLQELT